MHNMPGFRVGDFAIRPGPMMAADRPLHHRDRGPRRATRRARIEGIDPSWSARHDRRRAADRSSSRSVDPLESAVISIYQFHARRRLQRHPADARRSAAPCARSTPQVRDAARAHARSRRATSPRPSARRRRSPTSGSYPVTVNHPSETEFAADVAARRRRREHVDTRPAAADGRRGFLLHAAKRGPAPSSSSATATAPALHHPAYDFNDEAAPYGVSLFAKIVEDGNAGKGGAGSRVSFRVRPQFAFPACGERVRPSAEPAERSEAGVRGRCRKRRLRAAAALSSPPPHLRLLRRLAAFGGPLPASGEWREALFPECRRIRERARRSSPRFAAPASVFARPSTRP